MKPPVASLNGRPRGATDGAPAFLELHRADRLLVFAPHPDDEALALGGLLSQARDRGASVQVVYVTSGENNPWAQRACELRWRIGPVERQQWGRRREAEALASLARLGVPAEWVSFLHWPDQGLIDLLLAGADQAIETLTDEIARARPTILFAPSLHDLHPDHNALAVMICSAVRSLGAYAPPISLAYTVHSRADGAPPGAYSIALGANEIKRKRQAILCHQSQLRLRYGFVLGFGGRPERFDAIGDVGTDETSQTIRILDAALDHLHLSIERPPRIRLGPSELQILLHLPNSGLRALSLPLRPELQPVTDREACRVVASARVVRVSGRYEARIPLPPHAAEGADVYVKLEQPLLRLWGFFDHAGWRHVALRSPVSGARDLPVRNGLPVPAVPEYAGSGGFERGGDSGSRDRP